MASQPLQIFPSFSKLPFELRNKIWEYALLSLPAHKPPLPLHPQAQSPSSNPPPYSARKPFCSTTNLQTLETNQKPRSPSQFRMQFLCLLQRRHLYPRPHCNELQSDSQLAVSRPHISDRISADQGHKASNQTCC